MDTRVERVKDRCRRICGDNGKSECYVNKKEQIKCISDIVVNKTSSIMMALSASLQMDDEGFLKETARESLSDACELSNWTKYLQIVPDLLTLSSLVLDSDATEKRSEIRYPLPAEYAGKIRVIFNNMAEGDLVNFSQSGLRVASPVEVKKGDILTCHLITDVADIQRNVFQAEVMYAVGPNGSAGMFGARVREMQGTEVFNFFSLVHQLMLDTVGA